MTTETTDTQLSQFDLMKQEANAKIATMTLDDIAGYITNLKVSNNETRSGNSNLRGRLQKLLDTVTEFIKENLEEGASHDDLKQLAEDLEIELTKTVKVEMKISYYADVTVPIDFNVDDISESDFEVEVTANIDSDADVTDESTEIDDFSAEEE